MTPVTAFYKSITYLSRYGRLAGRAALYGAYLTKYMMDSRIETTRRFGVMELMITLAIVILLVSIAVPAYDRLAQTAKVARSIGDIGVISIEVGKFQLRNNDALPENLDELGADIPLDPWDSPYAYLRIVTAGSGDGEIRKDNNLKTLNSDFDLYSLGKDGDSAGPLSAKASRDDIVRANNGAFIGLGEDY